MNQYLAGACNIGPKNRVSRVLFGLIVLIASVYASAYLKGLLLPRWTQFILIIPLYVAFLGIWQGLFGFCVMHASKGTYDLR